MGHRQDSRVLHCAHGVRRETTHALASFKLRQMDRGSRRLGVGEMVSAPQTNGLPEGEDRLQSMYFERALNYHIAARYAVVARLAPVSGNLAHHAIEFYLKGALIKELDQAARRKMGHKLLKLWRRYKRGRQNPALDKFDQTISDINKFERIRYPEEILRLGMSLITGFVRNITQKSGQEPSYDLALDEVDALAKLIFQIENKNPGFFTNRLNVHGRQYLEHENKSRL